MKLNEKIMISNPMRVYRLSFSPFRIRIYPDRDDITLFVGSDWEPFCFPKDCMYVDVMSRCRIVRIVRDELVTYRRRRIGEFIMKRLRRE